MTGAPDSLWLTARQIADLRLAGLPTTESAVIRRAQAEGWQSKPRPGRGGGKLYSALGLPEAARDDFTARHRDVIDEQVRPVGRPAGSGFFDRNPEVSAAVEALVADAKVSSRNLMKLLAALGFAELPSPRTLRRHVKELEQRNLLLFTARRDPDRFKSLYRPALGRMDATVTYAHEMWEIDTTKADVLCTDGRKNVLGIIDRWSRRARFLVVESESAQSVRRMLVTTIAAWGVMPAILKVDNGSGFINASVGSALDLLQIKLDPCLPGTPEDKPHVERLFGTFNRERAALLPGFSGHSVADASKLRAKAKKETGRAQIVAGISSTQLQTVLDAWVDGEYHQRTHTSLRMSPMEKWQRSPSPARAAPDETVLKVALSAYVGIATVSKRGVRWKNGRYWSPALVAHMGRQVVMRRDEDDLGALFLFDGEGNYIDTAVNAERSGMSEQAFAMAARHQMTAHMNAARDELRRKQRTYSIEQARDELLRAEAEAAGKLVHLPVHTAPYTTASIDSITAAPTPEPVAPARLEQAMRTTQPAAPVRSIDQKVGEADALIMAAARGDVVDPDALRRAELYAGTSEYRAHKMVTGEFRATGPVSSRRQGVA